MAAAVRSEAVTPARMTASDRVVDLPPPGVLGLLAGGRAPARPPRCGRSPSGSRRYAMPVSTQRTSPCGERALGAQQRAGDVAVDGPGQVGLVVRHHLPDRVEDVGLGAELEDAVQEGGGEIGLADAGREPRLDLGHGLLGDPQRVAQAGQLVGGLDDAGRAHDLAGGPRRPVGEQQRRDRGASPRSPRRRRWSPSAGTQLGERARRRPRRPRRRRGRSGRAGGRRRGRARSAASAEERREQVGHLVVGQDDGDRALDVGATGIAQRPARPGGVGDVGVGEQDQRVDALVGHQRPEPGAALAPHPREIRLRRAGRGRSVAGVSRSRHQRSRPRKVLTLVLTSLTAASGPTASTTLASDCSE